MFDPNVDSVELKRARQSAYANLFAGNHGPLRIGHYAVLGLLGVGGFSTVWAARDVRLQRTVALKRLARREDDEHGSRLKLEARMLARVDHPNVVKVFEVFEHEGSVFAAFEHVRGPTLHEWLATPRSESAIDRVFMDAARALAAVHEAGLAHGDFKPLNVIVGEGEIPKLLDFGLCTPVGQLPEQRGGTPAYMAPEQCNGGEPTRAGDQYALCLSWLQAHGKVNAPASHRGRREPKKIRSLRRGVAPVSAERWESIDALLHAISQTLVPRRSYFGVALPVVGAAVAALAPLHETPPPDVCQQNSRPVFGIAMARMHDDFEMVAPRHGGRIAAALGEALDAWTVEWRRAHANVCTGAFANTDAVLACLDDQRQRVEALVASFAEPTREAVMSAATSAYTLPRPGACVRSSVRLASVVSSETTRRLYARLFAARTVVRRADPGNGEATLRTLIADAKGESADGVRGEAMLVLAQLLNRQGRREEAIVLAEEAYQLPLWRGNGWVNRQAAVLVTAFYAQELDRDNASRWARAAEALADPVHTSLSDRAVLNVALGVMAANSGDLSVARTRFLTGIRQVDADPRPMPQVRTALLGNLAELEIRDGNAERALSLAQSALHTFESAFGSGDVSYGGYLINAGRAATAAGEHERAEVWLRRAVKIADEELGSSHPYRALARHHLAAAEHGQRAFEAAESDAREALRLANLIYGADDERTAETSRLLAYALLANGSADEAALHVARADEILGDTWFVDGERLRAQVELSRFECDEAVETYSRLLARMESEHVPTLFIAQVEEERTDAEQSCRPGAD